MMILNSVRKLFFPEPYIDNGNSLKNKVVIITGARRGIGLATAQLLRKKGAKLALISRKFESKKLDGVLYIEADISIEEECRNAISLCIKNYGKIDCLINNAGTFIDKSLDQTTLEEFKKIFENNVFGMFNMTRLIVPFMKKQKMGTIINIGSKISHNSNVTPNKVTYATSKYAVEGFSFSLNKELKKFGIRVCCLMPGTVSTFISRLSKDYLSPFEVANLIKIIIESENIDFESIVFKSVRQNI